MGNGKKRRESRTNTSESFVAIDRQIATIYQVCENICRAKSATIWPMRRQAWMRDMWNWLPKTKQHARFSWSKRQTTVRVWRHAPSQSHVTRSRTGSRWYFTLNARKLYLALKQKPNRVNNFREELHAMKYQRKLNNGNLKVKCFLFNQRLWLQRQSRVRLLNKDAKWV